MKSIQSLKYNYTTSSFPFSSFYDKKVEAIGWWFPQALTNTSTHLRDMPPHSTHGWAEKNLLSKVISCIKEPGAPVPLLIPRPLNHQSQFLLHHRFSFLWSFSSVTEDKALTNLSLPSCPTLFLCSFLQSSRHFLISLFLLNSTLCVTPAYF